MTLLEYINGPLCEYINRSPVLPRNLKDYLYLKFGTRKYQLIDLGDKSKWNSVEVPNGVVLVEMENLFGVRIRKGSRTMMIKFSKLKPDAKGFMDDTVGLGKEIQKVYGVITDRIPTQKEKTKENFPTLIKLLRKGNIYDGVKDVERFGIAIPEDLMPKLIYGKNYPKDKLELQACANLLVWSTDKVFGVFLRILDQLHKVENKLKAPGILFYRYLTALYEIKINHAREEIDDYSDY